MARDATVSGESDLNPLITGNLFKGSGWGDAPDTCSGWAHPEPGFGHKEISSGVQFRPNYNVLMRAIEELVAPYVEALRTRIDATGEVDHTVDPVIEWMNAHADEVARHKGKRIAIHPEKGIVASADTYDEVRKRVDELSLIDEITFFRVPIF